MAEQKQFKSISIEQATYEKLLRLAQQHYRSVPKEIAYLVDEAWEHEQEQEQCNVRKPPCPRSNSVGVARLQ